MNLDKTKIITIVVFTLTVVKMVKEFIVSGAIDFTNTDILAEGVIALAAVIAGYTHHNEVDVALNTPAPIEVPPKTFKVGDELIKTTVEKGQIKAKKVVKKKK